jgi:trehalose synthase
VLQKVAVARWSLDAYEGIAPAPSLEELREHARALRGARILHVNATPYGGSDFIVVHDPQPAGLLRAHGKKGTRWVWRCHIDTSEPNPDAWRFLAPYLEGFGAAVFTMREFAPPDLPVGRVEVIAPAIDPLSPKNIALDPLLASQILDWIGMEIPGRLITQVSRFDQWKDPLGVIDAYRLVREQIPDLQLALVGSMALDDPEGWDVYRQVSDAANHDPLIHVYTNLTGVGNPLSVSA